MNLKAEEKRSPMMAQWYACKEKAKDALLLFRLGDFYEAFYEDAALLSRTVDVTLTQRQGVPMSGVPAHAAEGYIEKLVSEGYLVAIAEQIEDPKMVKGIVKREVVRIVSPGTLLSSLPDKDNNFFASLAIFNKLYALAFLDLSTGELRVMEVSDLKEIKDELFRSSPSELLISEKDYQTLKAPLSELQKSCHFRITERKNWEFNPQAAHGKLTAHFQTHNLDGFGLQGMVGAVIAAGALLSYIGDELHLSTSHIRSITREELSTYLSIDQATERNLELTRPLHGGGKQFTLLKLLDHTSTPMGARLLKSWLTHPLLSVEEIQKRQEGVEELLSKKELGAHLKPVRDVERLMMRVMSKTANPRDLIALKESLRVGEKIQPVVLGLNRPIFQTLSLPDCQKIVKLISSGLTDEPPVKLGEGRVIREGLHKELDELRELKQNGQSWIAKYQAELKEQGRIKNLKIIYSKAFGYCIEVSRGQAHLMPPNFERRQTLVSSERFISPELKAYEEKILNAEERIQEIEKELFNRLLEKIGTFLETITAFAQKIAILDVLYSLAIVAWKNRYVKPTVNDSDTLAIEGGRHPVIEASLRDESFIPNDVTLNKTQKLHLITGPNMAGKSTYIRQVALITIMAQMGGFVPASSATIGVVDKVFSRIGASDDLSRGQSTFMIEMTETANILHNATSRSLIILDEIGRGTSTFDGISIAWAVAEHLLKKGSHTLFATHYSELCELEKEHPGVINVHVAVQEAADQIVFLRKILPGNTDKSYGIHVGRLAGLPEKVVARSHEVLKMLEKNCKPHEVKTVPQKEQLSLFQAPPPHDEKLETLREELNQTDLNQTTPLKALQLLSEWKERLS